MAIPVSCLLFTSVITLGPYHSLLFFCSAIATHNVSYVGYLECVLLFQVVYRRLFMHGSIAQLCAAHIATSAVSVVCPSSCHTLVMYQNYTSSSAVADRARDVLCPSVVSLNKIITRAESLIIVT